MKASKFIQALIFVIITFTISWIEQYFIIHSDGVKNYVRVFALMWTPGLAALVCSWIFDRSFKSIVFKIPDLKSMMLSYFIPAITAVLIVGLLIVFEFATFEINPQLIEKKGSLSSVLLTALLFAPTVGMLLAFVSGLGEEIGWRGFLHTKLEDVERKKRYLIIGLIWSVWHWPLILFGDYATSPHPWVNVLFFTTAMTALSFFMGSLRDRSKSVFPAALVHASHNMWILGIAPVFFKTGPFVPYFGGESGFFCAIIYLLIAKGSRLPFTIKK